MQGYPQSQPYPTTFNQPSREVGHEDIIGKIEALDRQNRTLLSIADNIMKTSFMRQTEQTPAVIVQLEEDMKLSFNELIESIREFFLSIDSKLMELGQIIENRIGEGEGGGDSRYFKGTGTDSRQSKAGTDNRYAKGEDSDKMDNLVMRIAFMEENIKRSQDN